METSSIRPQTSSVLLNGSATQGHSNNGSVRGGSIKGTSAKQVSFRGDLPVPTKNKEEAAAAPTDSSSNIHQKPHHGLSDRSTDSFGSRESSLSRESTSTPSLGSRLMRTQKNRDPLKYYEVIKVLGDGSMGSVSKVKKRKSAVGGSARKAFVEESKREHALEMFPCLSFCFPGSKERKREDAFVTVDVAETGEGDAISAVTDGNSSSGKASSASGKGDGEKSGRAKLFRKTSSMITYGSDITVIYALKSIILDRVMDSTFRKELLNEIEVLRSIDHPNIVKPIETFDYQNRIYLVLELCNGGDLYARDPYTESQAMSITYSLLDAIAYLHSKDITHRDLKYENIMFASPTSPSVKVK